MEPDLILNIRPVSEPGFRFSRIISVPAGYTLAQLYLVVSRCFTYDMEALATAGLKDNEPYFFIHEGEIDDINEIMQYGAPTVSLAYSPIPEIIDETSDGGTRMMPWTCTTVEDAFDWPSGEDTCLLLQMWGWDGPDELMHVIERVGYSTELTDKAKFIGGHGQVRIVNNEFEFDDAASSRFPAELQSIGVRLRSREVEEEIADHAWAHPFESTNWQ
ncbi:MAG: hypothetical protein OHK93_004590 [Ramalina farinacea]|uniref:Uncharacterized protein n=1 Tax=Ramalina farinacea TaxID=258253 RepID=A0AA43QUQ5_9LECA|nr:hypothetical protein [Ramalina farinacea]